MPTQTELRQQITERIVQALQQNTIPWRRPWRVSPNAQGRPRNVVSKRPYQGVNTLLLALHGMAFNFESRWYATYPQWQALGGQVKKRPAHVRPGHWGCQIVFFKPLTRTVTDPLTGEEEEKTFPLLRGYTVFCADQVEGEAVEKFKVLDEPVLGEAVALAADFAQAQKLLDASGAATRTGHRQAGEGRRADQGPGTGHQAPGPDRDGRAGGGCRAPGLPGGPSGRRWCGDSCPVPAPETVGERVKTAPTSPESRSEVPPKWHRSVPIDSRIGVDPVAIDALIYARELSFPCIGAVS